MNERMKTTETVKAPRDRDGMRRVPMLGAGGCQASGNTRRFAGGSAQGLARRSGNSLGSRGSKGGLRRRLDLVRFRGEAKGLGGDKAKLS